VAIYIRRSQYLNLTAVLVHAWRACTFAWQLISLPLPEEITKSILTKSSGGGEAKDFFWQFTCLSVRASLTFTSGQSFSGRLYCFSGGRLAHTAFQSGLIFMVVHMLVIQATLFEWNYGLEIYLGMDSQHTEGWIRWKGEGPLIR